MHTPIPSEPLVEQLLQHLAVEEQLLGQALELAAEHHETLKSGNFAPLKTYQPRQEELAEALRTAADRREAAAILLGRALGLPAEGLTLAKLAARLGEPEADRIAAVRGRLSRLTAKLGEFQKRNANLIRHLRSFFRSVLSALTKTSDVPVRYGASGACLTPAYGASIKTRG